MFSYMIEQQLELRLLKQEDAQEVFELIENNRTYLREWLGWLDYSTELKDALKNIHQNRLLFATEAGLDLAIIYNGAIVGKVGLNSINKTTKSAEIGYMLGEEFNGKGIMTKATKALVQIAFQEYKLNKIEIRVATENVKSRAIPQRLGFTEEGTLRSAEWLYDHFVDHVVYGMLKEEWQQLQK